MGQGLVHGYTLLFQCFLGSLKVTQLTHTGLHAIIPGMGTGLYSCWEMANLADTADLKVPENERALGTPTRRRAEGLLRGHIRTLL